MTPQEREQLTQFLKQLAEARAGEKSPEADALIRETVARQPDAAYLLVQRAMLVEQALNAAKAQIAQLQSQAQARPAGGGSFLGGGNPWAQGVEPAAPGPAQGAGVPGAGNYQMPRGGAFNAAPAAPVPAGGGAGSFLGSVATTAAGVVAGGFLFQGLESLLGGGHHSSPSSLWGDSGPAEPVSEQTIINNYYDSPREELARDDGWAQPDDEAADFLADDSDLAPDDDSDWA